MLRAIKWKHNGKDLAPTILKLKLAELVLGNLYDASAENIFDVDLGPVEPFLYWPLDPGSTFAPRLEPGWDVAAYLHLNAGLHVEGHPVLYTAKPQDASKKAFLASKKQVLTFIHEHLLALFTGHVPPGCQLHASAVSIELFRSATVNTFPYKSFSTEEKGHCWLLLQRFFDISGQRLPRTLIELAEVRVIIFSFV